ncbi:TPM domain-containing protein [Chlorogloeopsis sp. ULAP01]|uniref:TPM domain-containing protein n=1 Tax=Chlorogloeopsis sp. ULAP01 TaxID=3056483 RepID=UPI0025AA70AC|nr:TPM domain-containing protein [Chlorogloeopsis sp. ULAP01]MDM9382324.1 TPM domain-containing protein [Chlorogloeopsis sp. ULAP01]
MKFNLLKPKRFFLVSLFSCAIFVSPLSTLAVTVKEVPNPRQQDGGWVTDMAGILSQQTEAEINQMISQLEAKHGTEIAVVTVPQTTPSGSVKKFATELFNDWAIGKKGQDNGVLFLISVGDRRVEIETGYGVEAILPDAKVGNIIDTQIIPRFKQGDFEGGTLAGTKALVLILEGDRSSSTNQVTTPNRENGSTVETSADPPILWGFLAGGGILVLAIAGAAHLKRRPQKILIAPQGHSRKLDGNYTFLCADCQKPMEKVDETTVQSYLSKPEKTAQKLGSVRFEGWKCPNCSHKLTGSGFHIVAQQSHSSRFKKCPHCQELTVTRSEQIVRPATQYNSGRRLITDDCHSCAYHHQQEEIIPRLPPPPPPPPPSTWGGYSGGGFSGGGGGSFGGGSSGGGGAGGSW